PRRGSRRGGPRGAGATWPRDRAGCARRSPPPRWTAAERARAANRPSSRAGRPDWAPRRWRRSYRRSRWPPAGTGSWRVRTDDGTAPGRVRDWLRPDRPAVRRTSPRRRCWLIGNGSRSRARQCSSHLGCLECRSGLILLCGFSIGAIGGIGLVGPLCPGGPVCPGGQVGRLGGIGPLGLDLLRQLTAFGQLAGLAQAGVPADDEDHAGDERRGTGEAEDRQGLHAVAEHEDDAQQNVDARGDEEGRGHGLGPQLTPAVELKRAVEQGPDAQRRTQLGGLVGHEQEDDGRNRDDGLTVNRGAHVQWRACGLEDEDQGEEDEIADGEVIDDIGRQAQLRGVRVIARPEDRDETEDDSEDAADDHGRAEPCRRGDGLRGRLGALRRGFGARFFGTHHGTSLGGPAESGRTAPHQLILQYLRNYVFSVL